MADGFGDPFPVGHHRRKFSWHCPGNLGGAVERRRYGGFNFRTRPSAHISALGGGSGVRVGSVVESLYREIRALRIYEGASEVQRLIIGRDLLSA